MATKKQQNDAVLVLLQDLSTKIDRNFDQLHQGQVGMFNLFQNHQEEDKKQFGSIKEAIDVAKGEKSAEDKSAQNKTTLWMLGVTALAGVPGIEQLGHFFGWWK